MANDIVRAADVDVDQLQVVARLLATSGYFEAAREPNQAIAQMAVKVLAGREMGFGPFASVQGIYLISGKPSVSANLMASAVKNSPRYDYRVRKMDAQECILEFFERDITGKLESIGVSSFTYQEGKTAGVKNLDKFPRNMLFARALSNGVRWYCPNVFNGNAVYVPEELGADTNEDNEIVTVQAQPQAPAPKPNGNPGVQVAGAADGDIDKARKAFHAQGVSVFGKDWEAGARHGLIRSYTTKRTPADVRESTNELTAGELTEIRMGMVNFPEAALQRWEAEKAAKAGRMAEAMQAAADAPEADAATGEYVTGNDNPFEK